VTRPPPMPHQAPSRAGQFQAPGGAPLAATQYGAMGDALNAEDWFHVLSQWTQAPHSYLLRCCCALLVIRAGFVRLPPALSVG
jgi:hypothetical protein